MKPPYSAGAPRPTTWISLTQSGFVRAQCSPEAGFETFTPSRLKARVRSSVLP
ncbi:MAG: hypothetical protein IPN83_00745 [Holophagales bacterium]|nr:hypothetical protein [Holophagales bacterium]